MCVSPELTVTTYRALRDAGVSRTELTARLATGDLTRLRRGVYATGDACPAVSAAASHGGALACVTAARHLGLWVLCEETSVHVWLRASGHRRHDPAAGCDCVEHWDEGPAVDSFGIPSVPRILRQILACRGVEEFFVMLESALRHGSITAEGLGWLRDHTNPAARDAMELARSDADSGLESLLRWRLRRLGLSIRTQRQIHAVGVVDILIGNRLLIEADGVDNHASAPLRHKDLVRDANAAAWRYVTLHFDYALIVHDWDLVERAILGQILAGHHL
ncbi:type IV toxin-antitoxin system AbiEi family antitoxin domain-containing protein [Microbacterium sp. 18062]|uniref:type IV toxin-antitoxin system AbiEi family antitoxin domain-containing protein n=1 Tax=Microbacterium sp. 18062 TaxID=2681410 RepID=UPI001357EE24|nr:type IV toxin-antitoxin system AbiEi family antitoxin domain-containing protein [Microbacterium sp. 18062]